MKNLNEKGFATLEVVLALSIISVLAFVAVPKIVQIMDKIFLDYEVERFCSEIDYARTLNRAASYNAEIFQGTITSTSLDDIDLRVYKNLNSYELRRNDAIIREKHELGGGVKLEFPNRETTLTISFNDKVTSYKSNVHTVKFTSRLGKSVEVNIDSVGRTRGKRNEN